LRAAFSEIRMYSDMRVINFCPDLPISENFTQVGHCKPTGGPKRGEPPPPDWPECVAVLPEVGAYHKPDRGPMVEKAALRELYSHQRLSDSPLAEEYLERSLPYVVEDTPKAVLPVYHCGVIPSPFQFVGIMVDLNPQAHAGYPWCLTNLNKFDFVNENLVDVYLIVCLRILALMHLWRPNMTAREYFQYDLCDPCFVKIKNEMIKMNKTPRIIAVVSAIDELIERLYLTEASKANKAHWGEFYSCIGIGFTQESSDRLLSAFEGVETLSNDTPKMDVTRTQFESILDCVVQCAQYDLPSDHPMTTLMRSKTYAASLSLFVFQDGVVWSQTHPGCTKTGMFGTSTNNTLTRARRSYAVNLFIADNFDSDRSPEGIRCAGDDAAEPNHPNLVQAYAILGFPLRDSCVNSESLSFCSHDFVPGRLPIGQRIAKSAANLLYRKEIDDDRMRAFIMEFNQHPEFLRFLASILVRRPLMKLNDTTNFKFMSRKKKQSKKTTTIVVKQRAPKRRAPRRAVPRPMSGSHHAVHAACSITDPFCVHAKASKWPDATLCVTIPWAVKGSITVSSDANGIAACVLTPSFPFGYAVSTSNVAGIPTYASLTQYDNTSSITASTAQYRLVSGGFKVTSITSAIDSSGFLYCQEYSSSENVGIGSLLNYTSTAVNSYYRQSCKDNRPVSYVFRPAGPQSRQFVLQNTNSNTLVTNDWTFAQVSCQGCPASSPIFVIDYIFNIEFIPYQTSGLVSLASRSNPMPQAIKDASFNTLLDMPSFITGDEETVSGKIANTIKKALMNQIMEHKGLVKSTVTGLATSYGGPIVGSLVGGAISKY
jgi:hypothetical protein